MKGTSRLGLRGHGIRLRFTVLYMALFLLSGAALLGITIAVFVRNTKATVPFDGRRSPAAERHIAALQAQVHQLQDQQLRQLLMGAAVALVVMAVVSPLLGRTVAGRMLRPLRTITAATRRITADDLHRRLAVAAPHDEVKDLADTIDGLLERLEAAFDAQRLFAANASHELRTPLATMRAALDVAMAKPGPVPASTTALSDRLRAELDQIDRLLDGLLTLARTQHGTPQDLAEVPLARLVSDALDVRAADVAVIELTVDSRLDDRVWIRGSRALLALMVDNLIDNAVAHNHPGGWIRVGVAGDEADARLLVETGGSVLDREQVGRLARPFHRLGVDRTGGAHGSGLGLSIVSAVAATHGGSLDLHARPEGGLRVTVTLPRSAVPAGSSR
ncbi:sensor histidine kinase [Streptomyces sp. NPDC090088]|uniref:sensor histidine kinase n=1 Tax=Streptomyces sp. NPDC090088 TaxID=3365944 RepID=UPI00381F3881